MAKKTDAIQKTIDTAIADNKTGIKNGAATPASNEAEKQHRERRYNASVYLDTSDPEQFYLIVAAGTVVHAVFEYNPKTCVATDRSANRMLFAAARTLLKDKGSLIKLASYRLEKTEVSPNCKFHPDNFGAVFASLAVAFTHYMPKTDPANE